MISEFPLFVFTTLAGMSAGAYVANAVFPLESERRKPWLFQLVCLVLLGLGLLGCLGHLARPMSFMNALANPTAGIAQEAYASIAFGILLLADFVVLLVGKKSIRAINVVGAVAGLVLMAVMGFAYTGYFGVPAWVSPATVSLFVLGDLLMGFALRALFSDGSYENKAFCLTTAAVAILSAVSFFVTATHFSGLGQSMVPFIVAALFAFVCIALAIWACAGGKKWIPVALFLCALVGVCVARWAFYAVGTI